MAKKPATKPDKDNAPRVQYAALPWRRRPDGEIEVLLITSRETRRWVIPKGWPMKGLKSPKTAAREAYEEAGVEGDVSKRKLGDYHYEKRMRNGDLQHVRVAVYSLEVTAEAKSWPEMDEREKLWTTPDAAAPLVQEPELSRLIGGFAQRAEGGRP